MGCYPLLVRYLHVNSTQLTLLIEPHDAGEQHRRQRKLLNPVFSSRHLAEMIPVFYEVTRKVGEQLCSRVSEFNHV